MNKPIPPAPPSSERQILLDSIALLERLIAGFKTELQNLQPAK